jgi:hypothetical protein
MVAVLARQIAVPPRSPPWLLDAREDPAGTAVIVEQHDEWAVAEHRYLSEISMAHLRQATPAVPATTSKGKRLASPDLSPGVSG